MTSNSNPPSGPEIGSHQAIDSNDANSPETSADPRDKAYAIGYRRPPRHSQFQPGHSGNPSGRAKRSRNLSTILKAVLEEPITIREGERTRRVPRMEALVRTLYSQAVKGDPKAVSAITILMRASGYGSAEEPHETTAFAVLDPDDLLADFLQRNAVETSTADQPSDDNSSKQRGRS